MVLHPYLTFSHAPLQSTSSQPTLPSRQPMRRRLTAQTDFPPCNGSFITPRSQIGQPRPAISELVKDSAPCHKATAQAQAPVHPKKLNSVGCPLESQSVRVSYAACYETGLGVGGLDQQTLDQARTVLDLVNVGLDFPWLDSIGQSGQEAGNDEPVTAAASGMVKILTHVYIDYGLRCNVHLFATYRPPWPKQLAHARAQSPVGDDAC
ncbi:hypothetical protein RSOLAG1IB_11734 [Rhizoctonia solani AG-1 IB]|uniref:Uncharacterized protein n=1 Tax=Thanatephorus cucumeris (strain AG1-IB / isolate 7/3/14) TaxID=1108050 RepID=A0A0B7FCL9_THACB|nr:hypothetical protein RSOLAG1IB_11734 [Rhizoctonia solani AG-1 IB]